MSESTPEQIEISRLQTQLEQANKQSEDQQKARLIEHAARVKAEALLNLAERAMRYGWLYKTYQAEKESLK